MLRAVRNFLIGLVIGIATIPLLGQIIVDPASYINMAGTALGGLTIPGTTFITGAGSAFGVGNVSMINTAPVATTFCTSPSVPANNGTFAFTVNVGTACATSVGTITFPSATTGWVIECHNVTAPATNIVEQTGGSTTTATITNYVRTTGVAGNWTDSNILRCSAKGY